MPKVLITGGAGFVGRRFCKRLLENGWEVHCVDPVIADTGGILPETGWPLFEPRDFDKFHFYPQDCREWFRNHAHEPFDYAMHLAAMVGGRAMIEGNPLAVADDLSIDAEFWQWAKVARPEKTVCFSSSAAYPIKYQRAEDYRLLTEDMISFESDLGMPDMSYGWAKLTCEYLARLAFEKHGLKSVCYRPFSGYGEDQDDTYPFPSIVQRIMDNANAPTIKVWGTGDQMRDFIHIENCVDGVLKTMDQIDNADALNLATGRYLSFKAFAKMAANLYGYDPEVVGSSGTPAGVFARGGDPGKAAGLGFSADITFEEGIKRAIEYFEKKRLVSAT